MKRTMSNETKRLMIAVMDNYHPVTPILHQIQRFKDRNGVLKWLILNRIVGKEFVEFLKVEHENSVLSMVKWIIMKQKKAKQLEAIIQGKDWS